MPATTLDDGGWGSIISNFGNALVPDPSSRAKMMLMGSQFRKNELDIEEQRRKMEALRKSIMGFPSTIPPEVTLPGPSGMEEFGPARPEVQQSYSNQRNQRIYDNAASTLLAKSAEDYAKGVFGTRAIGEISGPGGIPQDPRRQDVLQTVLGGSGMSLPNYSTTPHTYQPTDAAGAAMGPAISSRRIPEGPSTMVSPGKAGPANPFENDASADQRLFQMSQKLRKVRELEIPELEEAAVHLANRYGVKNNVGKGPDGSTVVTQTREREIPEQFMGVATQVARMNWHRAESEAAIREGRPMRPEPVFPPPAGPASAPDAAVGGLVGGPPGAVGAAPAPPPPTVGGLPLGTNVGKPVQIAAGDATPLRKEFIGTPQVEKYYAALTPFKQFSELIKVGTPQSDVAMIYTLATMLDPQSVVREGEMLIWKKSGGPFDQLKGAYDRIVENKAALTPDIRAKLADMGERVMTGHHGAMKDQVDRYRELATDYGIDPKLVVPKSIPDLPKIDRKTISSIIPAGAGPKGKPERLAPGYGDPAAAPGGGGARPRTIRVNPDGTIVDVP